ncbi:hypothetical protein CPG37_00730 [Malaciobacter canalis]|uniref:Uncharacterized protein n=1 Tax=Malaciobacter canalis TaxID=1912871 RepID=A0ABX4LSS7_9BACT|nr:hypothetical protein [Malaciobacter canalis]PHO11004.1 hypothetical protein CPG37_00730 [Malaciobacter canalis]QEE33082.1 hypothetical protein ACAN_1607 [Malaciobacter canalis]
MYFLYIENYLNQTTKEQKKDFFNFLIEKSFVPSNQKIILSDKSLILEFDKNQNFETVKEVIKSYFKKNQKIRITQISKILKNEKKLILIFNNKDKKEIVL